MVDAAANDAMDALEACPCCLLGPQQRCLKTPYTYLDNTEIYSDMLKECFNIQLDVASDECGICEECVVRLRDASHFKRQVQRSQAQLHERLARALKIIEEEPPAEVKSEIADEDGESANLLEEEPPAEVKSEIADEDGKSANLEEEPPAVVKSEIADEDGESANLEEEPPAEVKSEIADEDGESANLIGNSTNEHTDVTVLLHKCPECNNLYKSQKNMADHIRSTHLTYNCPRCPLSYTYSKLQHHLKNTHSSEVVKQRDDQHDTPVLVQHSEDDHQNMPVIVSTTSLKQKTSTKRKQKSKKKSSVEMPEPTVKVASVAEMAKHQKNLETVLLYSNATPTRGHRGMGYGCYFCAVKYPDPADLKTHTLEAHSDLKFKPPQRLAPLNSYTAKLDITNLTCKLCFEMFTKLADLMDHLRINHNKFFHTDIKSYMIPFRFDHDPLKCAMCDTEFSGFRMAIEHMNVHYRNHICDVCDAGFVNRAGLRAHGRNHQYGDYPCGKCPQTFNSYMKLRYHIRCVHEGKGKRNKCAFCDKRFVGLAMKINHLVKEHGAAPVVAKCKACDKTFGSFQSLRMHYKTYHLQIKKHKCEYCDMQFAGSHDLKLHMVKHTGERNYKCDICGKAYGRKRTLVEHLRIHADDRRYKCGHCSMAFVQRCSYKLHLQVKHGIEKGNK